MIFFSFTTKRAINDTAIALQHSQRLGSPAGERDSIHGIMTIMDTKDPGRWISHWAGTEYKGELIIIKLSEIQDNIYNYAIITTPKSLDLFVIIRSKWKFYKYHRDEVHKFLELNNFTSYWNTPIIQYQGQDCANESTTIEEDGLSYQEQDYQENANIKRGYMRGSLCNEESCNFL